MKASANPSGLVVRHKVSILIGRSRKVLRGRADSQQGKVGHSAEPPKALADDAPFALVLGVIRHEAATNGLAIAHNAIRAEILHILCLFDSIALAGKRACCDGRAEARATLVEEQDLSTSQKGSANTVRRVLGT